MSSLGRHASTWLAHPPAQALFATALVLGLLVAFLVFTFRSTVATTATASSNEARVLATKIEGALRRVDMSAAFAADNAVEPGAHDRVGSASWAATVAPLNLNLAQLTRHFPEALVILVTDTEGRVIASSYDELPTWGIGDRDYFQHARTAPTAALQFSNVLTSKAAPTPTVVAYRARLRADGSFAGVVAVGLNLASFEAFLDRIDAGERGVVAVRRSDDSRLVMRRPAAPARINTADPWIPPYRMILDGKRRGVVRYASAVDDVDRIFAFQALQDYPFFVIVGRSVDEQFTVWRRTGVAAMAIAAATLTLLLAMQAGLRRSRARLARSEQDFDALVESRREASCTWQPDTTLLSCNARYAALVGRSPSELEGHRWLDYLPEHERPATAAAIEHLTSGAGALATDRSMRHSDGSIRWIRWVDLPVLDSEGRCVEIRSIGQDITAQKENELRLRQLALAVEQSPNTIVITNTQGQIEYVNASFTRTTGYAADEVLGQNPRLLNAGKTPPATYADLWATLERGEVWRGEFINSRKDESTYIELATIAPIKQPDGSVSHYVAIKEDITERRAAEARIRQLAYYDSLTGLPNRSLMWDRLRHAIVASERSGMHGMLLLLDIDYFKLLNDTQGHKAGDALLREVAQRLRAALREEDTVARLGDDDFAIVVEGLGAERDDAIAHAGRIAEHLHGCIAQPFDLGLPSGPYHGTASLGLTLFHGRANPAEAVLKQAEVAVDRAKHDGRNLHRFFSEAMQAVVAERASLELKLRAALAENRFRLFYQPQLDSTGRLIGAEALLRCFDTHGSMISPASFIPLAEETGLIVPIGDWVLQAACAQLRVWQAHVATGDLSLSINVSAKQFHQPDFVAKVTAAIERHRVNAGLLKIELTESVVIGDIETTVARMKQIKALGVRFALDDFGTGYSSLSYLKRLPFDQLKIDQAFVRDMDDGNSSDAIVRAILAISQSLDLEVVAEGVETSAQHERLLQRGCVMFQGYLFGKPVPIEAWPVG